MVICQQLLLNEAFLQRQSDTIKAKGCPGYRSLWIAPCLDRSSAIVMMWLGLAFASVWLYILGHSLHTLFALMVISLSQCQADRLAMGWKSSMQTEPKPLFNIRAHQSKIGNFCTKQMWVYQFCCF